MTIEQVMERIKGDGCTLSYVREHTGMGRVEALRWLAEAGALRSGGCLATYRIPSAERNAKAWDRYGHPCCTTLEHTQGRLAIKRKPSTGGSGS
jgi:hypothetical protein